jgi:hypothetical protein
MKIIVLPLVILFSSCALAHGIGYGKHYGEFYFLMISTAVFFLLSVFYGVIKGVNNNIFKYLLLLPFVSSIIGLMVFSNLLI